MRKELYKILRHLRHQRQRAPKSAFLVPFGPIQGDANLVVRSVTSVTHLRHCVTPKLNCQAMNPSLFELSFDLLELS